MITCSLPASIIAQPYIMHISRSYHSYTHCRSTDELTLKNMGKLITWILLHLIIWPPQNKTPEIICDPFY